jgi:hypothetical protein
MPKNAKQQRHLDQRRDAAAEHIHAVILLQLHDLGVHVVALGVGHLQVLVLRLDRVHLRLNALHLQTRLHGLDAQRQDDQVDQHRQPDDVPAPVGRDMLVDRPQRQEEVLADEAEEAEVQQRLERQLGVGGVDVPQHIDSLRPGKDVRLRVAGEIAQRGAQHRHAKPVRRHLDVAADDGLADILAQVADRLDLAAVAGGCLPQPPLVSGFGTTISECSVATSPSPAHPAGRSWRSIDRLRRPSHSRPAASRRR